MIFQKEVLTSRQNALVKWVASLQEKKYRDASKSFIAEGAKLTFEAASAGLPITHVFVSQSKLDLYIDRLNSELSGDKYKDCQIVVVSDSVFEKISTEKAPQGIISVIKHLDFFRQLDIIYKEDFFIKEGERAIALYSLRDPGNLGAVIRSCVAFGVEHVIVTADSADVYNPKTIRSAMGSLFRVKITVVRDFSSFIEASKGIGRRVFAAELTEDAVSLCDVKITADDIFMIGNEGHGIPKEISAQCSASVYIPISSKTESLNASVAASVFMWEQNKIR